MVTVDMAEDDSRSFKAVMAVCGRTTREVNQSWDRWSHFKFYLPTSSSTTLGEIVRKHRTKKGKAKVGGRTPDPFEDFTFETEDFFEVDQSYFHFWKHSSHVKELEDPYLED